MNQIVVNQHNGIRGEYRYTLRGPDGKIKDKCDWKPNMILDQGLYKMMADSNNLGTMALGTSGVAPVESQVGLQGTYLGNQNFTYGFAQANWSTVPYWASVQVPAIFASGNGTGTIAEYVICATNGETDAMNNAVIRVVLDTPIVKGSQDELTIEHRLYIYPDTAVKTGVIAISGVSYDYTLMWADLASATYGASLLRHIVNTFTGGPRVNYSTVTNEIYIDSVLPATVFDEPTGTVQGNGLGELLTNYVTNAAIPYRTITVRADVDDMNYTFDMIRLYQISEYLGSHYTSRVWQIGRTSDGAPFTKEDTHEFTFTYRTFLDRYVP